MKWIIIYLVGWAVCSILANFATVRKHKRTGKSDDMFKEITSENLKLLFCWWIALPIAIFGSIAWFVVKGEDPGNIHDKEVE